MSKYTKHVPRIMESVLNCPQGIRMCVFIFHLLCGRSICWKKHDLQGQRALGLYTIKNFIVDRSQADAVQI